MGRKRVRTNHTGTKSSTTQAVPQDQNDTCPEVKTYCDCDKERRQNLQSKDTQGLHSCKRNSETDAEKFLSDDRIFPRWFPWIIFVFTLFVRLFYVLEPNNWWILHPDEIYQTMEVAHSDAYGYGFRPYEYLQPPMEDIGVNSTLCEARQQAISLEMYSLRSFILPKLLSVVMLAADMSGISASSFLVIKVFHVVVTSSLPVSVFYLSRVLHSSSDVAGLSAVLVSVSLTMNIFGTHTLINSFISPVAILSLVAFVNIIRNDDSVKTDQNQKQQRATKNHLPNIVQLIKSTLKRKWCIEHTLDQYNGASRQKLQLQEDSSSKPFPSDFISTNNNDQKHLHGGQDENANVVHPAEISKDKNKRWCHSGETKEHPTLAAIFETPLAEFTSLHWTQTLSGVFLALCIYIRVDIVLLPLLLVLVNLEYSYTNLSSMMDRLMPYFLGMLCGFLIGGVTDYVSYGVMFMSPLQWLRFNVWHDYAGEIFGLNNYTFYIDQLYEKEPLFVLLIVVILADCVVSYSVRKEKSATQDPCTLVGASHQSLFIFICLLAAYSHNSHKELRFLHNAIVFFYIVASSAIISLYNKITRLFSKNQNGDQYFIYYLYLLILLFVSSHISSFFTMTYSDRAKWTYGGKSDSQGANRCLDFIRHQDDVTGVFVDSQRSMTGGYSILHKKVPIFALNIFEFMEYNYKTPYDVTTGRNNGVHRNGFTEFSDTSEFISIQNTPYLLKQLIDKPEYNYLVLKADRKFVDVGYIEVFRAGNSKVLKRIFESKSEITLAEISSNIMMGTNATVLEYEGHWLKHYGLYVKAEKRLIFANRLEPTRIGPFRILMDMYKTLNRSENYKQVLSACLQVHSSNICLRHYEPVKLQANYFRT